MPMAIFLSATPRVCSESRSEERRVGKEGEDWVWTYQAEDGIRDTSVTGVQTCALPILHFDFHNLKTEYLPQRNDVIFCRNVMMYFDEPEQKRLIEKFYRCLNANGYLFVGHAESLLGVKIGRASCRERG